MLESLKITCRLVLLQGLGDEGPHSLLLLADLLCELLTAVLGQCCQLSCRLFQFGRVLQTTEVKPKLAYFRASDYEIKAMVLLCQCR